MRKASKLERIMEADDPILRELRRRVLESKPHQPAPGDPDYQTPAQVARILRDRKRDGLGLR